MPELGRPTLMIVCGAGASSDSIATVKGDGSQPPITDTLFSLPRLRRFMQPYSSAMSLAAAVSADLAKPAHSDFEATLFDQYKSAKGNRVLERGFTALRFYLRDLLGAATTEWPRQAGGVTNYTWLVRAVETWRCRCNGYVLWVTFNYDGLLDAALEGLYEHRISIGEGDPTLHGYLSHPDWALVKLHGSYDWSRQTQLTVPPATSYMEDRQAAEVISSWLADLPSADTIYRRGGDQPLSAGSHLWAPALMAPLAAEKAFECPPSHVDFLKSRLTSIDLIYSIGWRAQDPHFLELLAAMRPNPPDVCALSKNEESARKAAGIIGRASDRNRPEDDTTNRPTIRVDKSEGFSGLVIQSEGWAELLGELVEQARDRRTVWAAEVERLGRPSGPMTVE